MNEVQLITAGEAVAAFDYTEMEADVAEEARVAVERYRNRVESYVLKTGRDLNAIKERLEHGLFLRWVQSEMGLNVRTAQNFMRADSELGHKSETVSRLPPTVLYQLAAPLTPAPVREDILNRIDAGESLSAHRISGIVRQAQAKAREEKDEAKLTPEQRQRKAKSRRDAEARHRRDMENMKRESEERAAKRQTAAAELAGILAPLLTDETYKQVYKLIHEVNLYDMRTALSEAYGPTAENKDMARSLSFADG